MVFFPSYSMMENIYDIYEKYFNPFEEVECILQKDYMTEEESRNALFKLNLEYMSHPPNERLALYQEYKHNRQKIREELARNIFERKQEDLTNSITKK